MFIYWSTSMKPRKANQSIVLGWHCPLLAKVLNKNYFFKMLLETFFFEYSKVSTIGGLVHVFRHNLSVWKRLFWIFVLLVMLMVGIYWSVAVLNNWKKNQVLVTIKSVGEAFFLTKLISSSTILKSSFNRFGNKWDIFSISNHLCRGLHQCWYFRKG